MLRYEGGGVNVTLWRRGCECYDMKEGCECYSMEEGCEALGTLYYVIDNYSHY